MEVVTITNQKGGVGKTTTAQILANGLAHLKNRVLVIDLDSQVNLTFASGLNPNEAGTDIYTLFRGKASSLQAVQKSPLGFDIIPGSVNLAGADMEFSKPDMLKTILEPLKEKYDYCVIDTPSAFGIMVINALTASDKVIVPMGIDVFSLQGFSLLQNLIDQTRKRSNPDLKIDGLLLVKYDPRVIIDKSLKEGIEEITKQFGTRLYKTCIRTSVAIKEIQFSQADIFAAYPRHNLTRDYKAFIKEFLE